MSQENVKKIVDLISTNNELKLEFKELCSIKDKAELVSAFESFAKKNGCECTFEEFLEFQKVAVSELSVEDLAKIDAGIAVCIGIGLGGGAGADVGAGACYILGVGIGAW